MTQFIVENTQRVTLSKVALSLGSNVPPKSTTIESAIGEIIKRKIGRVLLLSPLYKTKAVGNENQDWFVNGCLVLETSLKPLALLEALQKIEHDFGRVRLEKWGPRTLDIDILLYEGYEDANNTRLILPHPEMTKREFVLRPMVDMVPWIQVHGKTVQDHLKALEPTDMTQIETVDDRYRTILDMYWGKLSPRQVTPGTERIKQVLRHILGDYEQKIAPIIHIAGTNGKGSTAAILHKILNKAGKIVHRYTSPHIRSYCERYVLGVSPIENRFVTRQEFEIAVSRLTPFIDKFKLSHFEALTALAILLFSEVKADYIILETGMGGRLDATNIFAKPALTAITSISYDHMEFLGDMIEAIAFEKAGILKPNIPVIVGVRNPEASKVILDQAKSLNAPVSMINREWKIDLIEETEAFVCNRTDEEVFLDTLNLKGLHQLDNAGIAIEMARYLLDKSLPHDDDLDDGFTEVYWPARLEKLNPDKTPIKLPRRTDFLIDGCHNTESLLAFVEYMKSLAIEEGEKPLTILFSCKKSRNLQEVFDILSKLDAHFIFIQKNTAFEQTPVEELIEVATEFNIHFSVEETLFSVVNDIFADEEFILKRYALCGSLYFCGSFYNLLDYRIDI